MMRSDTGIITAGMAIVLSNGCYSDYNFSSVYIAIKDFNYMESAKEYFMEKIAQEYEKDKDPYMCSYELYKEFESWLIGRGYLAACNDREIHIGDYNFFDEQEWKEEFLNNIEKGKTNDK